MDSSPAMVKQLLPIDAGREHAHAEKNEAFRKAARDMAIVEGLLCIAVVREYAHAENNETLR